MLRFVDNAPRFKRRDFLRVGSFALGGMAVPGMLSLPALGADAASRLATGKSVIFLFLHGGPSQIETFDPKMTAPSGIRSATGEIQTSLPGVTFGSSFPKLAPWAHRLAIVRSFSTGDGNHDIKPVVGKATGGANLGTLFSRVVGTNHPQTGVPTNVALFPQAVDPNTQPAVTAFGKFDATGNLGSSFAPFVPGGGEMWRDMQLQLPIGRVDDRRALLSNLDRLRSSLDVPALDGLREQAYRTLLGDVSAAFDLSKEDPRTVARYNTSGLMRPEDISTKWNNHKNYKDNYQTLGKLLLMARRLCEHGAGFVTVTTNFVWDMHADINNATVEEGMRYMGPPLDHALSAYMEDIEARDLSHKILLVVCGEMGRTPRINNNGGRDHWGGLAPLLLVGGGLKMGQVVGQSSRDVAVPATEPMTISNLHATVLDTLFHTGELRTTRGVPTEILRAGFDASPIPGLRLS